MRLKQAIAERAAAIGFDACRITHADAIPQAPARLYRFLREGHHATMDWMEETAERRAAPRALWSEVRSIVMLGMNYGPETDPLENLARRDVGSISVYARHRDYHDVVKGKLKTLAGQIGALARQSAGTEAAAAAADVKVFVDTAPVMEKPLAAAAGLGWQGKHTNLVSRDFGSWLFLGAIFTTLDLSADEGEVDRCGSCRACLDICPTKAFPAPYRLDARRCISYLTIEHKGLIPPEFRTAIGNRIYGCDDCLAVCPWNKFAENASEAKLRARTDLAAPALADLVALDDAAFRAHFSGSPIKRIGRDRFIRNVLIAIGNSGEPALVPQAVRLLDDPAPDVRGTAVWALSRLLEQSEFARLSRERSKSEADPAVRAEWDLAASKAAR